jgi:carbonic anhydrase
MLSTDPTVIFKRRIKMGMSVAAGLKELKAGNKRYASGKMKHPRQGPARRKQLAAGQSPFAIIVCCSDSRVPPEILFDQGLGDLFVVRVAGNAVDDFALASVEYAAEHLGTGLIVVLGHTNCGAIAATIKGGKAPGNIGKLVRELKPAVARAGKLKGDHFLNAVRENVNCTAVKIRCCGPALKHLEKSGKIKIIEAVYDICTGRVEFAG